MKIEIYKLLWGNDQNATIPENNILDETPVEAEEAHSTDVFNKNGNDEVNKETKKVSEYFKKQKLESPTKKRN